MKIIKKVFFALFIFFVPFFVSAKSKDITVYLFYNESCPHCHAEIEFMEDYAKNNNDVIFKKYEVTNNSENKEMFNNVINYLKKPSSSVPYTIIGNQVRIGYDDKLTKEELINIIDYYRNNNYRNIIGEYLKEVPIEDSIELEQDINFDEKTIPIIGKINAKNFSLPIISIVIGLVDGFNPCAMWVLLFLITMLFGMKNRKKMWILGSTFLLSSALVYALVMISFLNLEIFTNKIAFLKIGIALVALIFGITNIVKYFKTKDVGCEMVEPTKRKKIMTAIKKILAEKSFGLSILGIIVLAISVNAIELLCSLGLPATFTQILSLNDVSTMMRLVYILIYIIFFMMDDFVVFIIAMKTSKLTATSNKFSKYSHLIGGLIMVIIGLLLLLKPEWLMFNF